MRTASGVLLLHSHPRCVANKLRLSGLDEVHSIIEEQGKIEVDREFYNCHYSFNVVEAE